MSDRTTTPTGNLAAGALAPTTLRGTQRDASNDATTPPLDRPSSINDENTPPPAHGPARRDRRASRAQRRARVAPFQVPITNTNTPTDPGEPEASEQREAVKVRVPLSTLNGQLFRHLREHTRQARQPPSENLLFTEVDIQTFERDEGVHYFDPDMHLTNYVYA